MKIHKKQNVLEAALERTRYFFDEFENIVVSFSGGKDSTVVLNLALMVAEEKGRLPLKVMFIDQEAEWSSVADYIKRVMYDHRVDPYWMQIPMVLYNSTSTTDNWLHCWAEEDKDKWIRERDQIAKTVNKYGTNRFKDLFTNIIKTEFGHLRTANLGGIRTDESPTRMVALTHSLTYKHITYGKKLNEGLDHYTFYPIYDWHLSDVWKFIYSYDLDYCSHYDDLFRHGCALKDMRVSNVHHETAVANLFMVQEIDSKLWSKLTKRIAGINTAGHLKIDSIRTPKTLPYMFKDWYEYREYLLDNLITDPDVKEAFSRIFVKKDAIYSHRLIKEKYCKACITAILANDTGAKLDNFNNSPDVIGYLKYKKGIRHDADLKNKFIQDIIYG